MIGQVGGSFCQRGQEEEEEKNFIHLVVANLNPVHFFS